MVAWLAASVHQKDPDKVGKGGLSVVVRGGFLAGADLREHSRKNHLAARTAEDHIVAGDAVEDAVGVAAGMVTAGAV